LFAEIKEKKFIININKKEYISLDIGIKRFLNISDKLVECYNVVLSKDKNKVILNYLTSILENDFQEEKDFLDALREFYSLHELKILTNNYINKTYDVHSSEVKESVINKQLVMNEKHCKDIQKISFNMKFFIPIIADYFIQHKNENKNEINLNNLFLSSFLDIIQVYNDNKVYNKIFKLVESRILSTQYSDKIIWNYLQNIGKDPINTVVSTFYKSIVLILYKIDAQKNPISFIHTSLKKQLSFIFRENIPIEYNPISTNAKINQDGVTAIDRMEIDFERIDEGLAAIQNYKKEMEFKKILAEKNKDEINQIYEELKDIDINFLQTKLVLLYFAKYFKNLDYYELNKEEFIILLSCLIDNLEKQKLNILAAVLRSSSNFSSKKTLIKKDFIDRLLKTKLYNNVVRQYKFVNSKFLIETKDPIFNIVSVIVFNKWENKDYQRILDNMRLEEVTYETLKFIKTI